MSEATPPTPDRVNRAVIALARSHRARAARLLGEAGLHPGQEVLLLLLAEHGPTPPGRVAQALGVEPATITKMVGRLEAADLVTRRPDPGDRRSTLVHLTAAGSARLEPVREAWERLAAETVAGVPAADRDRFVALLEAAAAGLGPTDGACRA